MPGIIIKHTPTSRVVIGGGADTPSDALRKAKQYTDARIAEIETFKKEVVPSLESITNPNTETLYLVPVEDGAGNQYCDEYFYFLASGDIPAHFEKVGSTNYTPDIAIEDKPSLNKLLVTLNPFNPQTKSQFLVARDPYDTPDAPTFSPATGGSGDGSLTVTISCTSSNVDIKYSLDNGATWTTGTSVTLAQDVNYESKSYTLKAKAVNKTSLLESDVVSATYTVKRKVATPVLNPATNTYNATQSVAITCGTSGATIYYTTDGTDPVPSEAGQEGKATKTYSSAISVTKTGTVIKAIATKTNWVTSNVKSATYTLKLAAPTISVDNTNKYAASHVVTIVQATADTLYYTTDGSTPTTSSQTIASGGTITLSTAGTYTVKVLAVKANWVSNSATKSGIIVGAKKCYIGQAASVSALSDVEGLANAYEQDTLVGSTKDVNVASSSATAQYTWFAIPNTAAKNLVVTVNNDSMPTPVPLQAAGGVLIPSTNSVYRVWRSKDPLFNLTGTYDFKFA